MKAIIKREIRNYLKNPVFWVGLLIVLAGVYQTLMPYLNIHYFESEQELQDVQAANISDVDIMNGYLPTTPEQQLQLGCDKIRQSLIEDLKLSKSESDRIMDEVTGLTMQEIADYFRKNYSYYGVENVFDDSKICQGSLTEVNAYLSEKLEENRFSYYFARKYADFGGLYMAFFSTVLLAFLFLRDTKRDIYELLHTKPLQAWQYVLGKVMGGFLVISLAVGLLNLVFGLLCVIYGRKAGFPVNAVDIWGASILYILPNMLMITSVYAGIALIFKNPLPATPLLFLYITYSNMGSVGTDGRYGYYGRPLAIMVRFPGSFFDTAPPPMVLLNQLFLIIASAGLILLTIGIWNRRRVY